MGREIKRVATQFDWPLSQVWRGYVNPHSDGSRRCQACEGSGYSPEGALESARWYGRAPFSPEETGSEPFTPRTPQVADFALRQTERSPEFYGSGPAAVLRESERLCLLWNQAWGHHLSQEDVDALWAEERLWAFDEREDKSWPLDPAPLAREVNLWSLGGMGHDSINHSICVRARCERLGVAYYCSACDGEGSVWDSEQARLDYEQWTPQEPPAGPAYQLWETVSEGSPVSPPFERAEDLARWLAASDGGRDSGVSYSKWLAFIYGPGWAPSVIAGPRGVLFGVEGM